MLIAGVQSDVSHADPEANVARVLRWMRLASQLGPQSRGSIDPPERSDSEQELPDSSARQSADLVVFPECMLTGYAFDRREDAMEVALPIDSQHFSTLSEAAKRYDQFVTLGFVERDGDRLYNSAAMLGPQGIVGCYRKIHLPHLGVDRFVTRGDRPYQTYVASAGEGEIANIGLGICYDASFPEPMRVLGLLGADVIALGTNWPAAASHTAEIVPPARSMENHLYFVAANRVGWDNEFSFCGKSKICGPDGVILARAEDDRETLLYADVDLAIARNKRIERTPGAHVIDRFADRRPQFYGRITEGFGSGNA
ncbi:carbon-nitrogen hydrolase family protein [Roseiconus nitratireducens]|uniref:Carbon-nitrogen hydrolase family protein n=1 Tax=Roseiconus nitratireducens TaxID=2605748 RepID=A0A5M6DLA7_9BACT|nr:carbon-nitrogen hydrolase family protein [Roseiconus nitratireducens]KAA5547186.1 carbon-nitrogen hydrolase family protein [Roseiconus nitratireducens]